MVLRRRRQPLLVSLLLTVALAVALGLIVWSTITSLPFLAVSPTTDPTFGALNACMLGALPERTGFAVSRDGTRLAAWSPGQLVICGPGASSPVWSRAQVGVTVGAFDGLGQLWVAVTSPDAGAPALWRVEPDGALTQRATVNAQALAGTAQGVVVFEPTGRLLSLTADGAVLGAHQLPAGDYRAAHLSTSGDGSRVVVFANQGVFAFTSALSLLRAEAPCTVTDFWWQHDPDHHRAVLACADGVFLTYDVDLGSAEPAPAHARVSSTLVGPQALWVQACDVLACTAPPP